jgi:hypothetical protein
MVWKLCCELVEAIDGAGLWPGRGAIDCSEDLRPKPKAFRREVIELIWDLTVSWSEKGERVEGLRGRQARRKKYSTSTESAARSRLDGNGAAGGEKRAKGTALEGLR